MRLRLEIRVVKGQRESHFWGQWPIENRTWKSLVWSWLLMLRSPNLWRLTLVCFQHWSFSGGSVQRPDIDKEHHRHHEWLAEYFTSQARWLLFYFYLFFCQRVFEGSPYITSQEHIDNTSKCIRKRNMCHECCVTITFIAMWEAWSGTGTHPLTFKKKKSFISQKNASRTVHPFQSWTHRGFALRTWLLCV